MRVPVLTDGAVVALNIKEGFNSLGEVLSGLMRSYKRSRQKSSLSSSWASDDESEDYSKRTRAADNQNKAEDLLLGNPGDEVGKAANVNGKVFSEILDSVVQDLDQEQLGPNVSHQLFPHSSIKYNQIFKD